MKLLQVCSIIILCNMKTSYIVSDRYIVTFVPVCGLVADYSEYGEIKLVISNSKVRHTNVGILGKRTKCMNQSVGFSEDACRSYFGRVLFLNFITFTVSLGNACTSDSSEMVKQSKLSSVTLNLTVDVWITLLWLSDSCCSVSP